MRRSVRHSSKPSMPGSMMSISTTSGTCWPNSSTASSPDAGALDGPALVLERQLDRLADALVVLDGQDSGSHGAHDARSARPIPPHRSRGQSGVGRARQGAAGRRRSPGWRRAARRAAAGRRGSRRVRQPASRAISSPAAASHAFEAGLVVGVEAAGGDVAQVERGRAEAADVADRPDEPRRRRRPARGGASAS